MSGSSTSSRDALRSMLKRLQSLSDRVRARLFRSTSMVRGADYDALAALSQEKGLKIVCDAAESLGSKYRGRPLGTFGDAACFSFSANKTITSGQGGMVATNSEDVY